MAYQPISKFINNFDEFCKFIYSNGIDQFELTCILASGIETKNTQKIILLHKNKIICNKIFIDYDNKIFGASEIILSNVKMKKDKIIFDDKNSFEINKLYKYAYLFNNFTLLQRNGLFFFLKMGDKKKKTKNILVTNFNEMLNYKMVINNDAIENSIS